MAKGLYRSFAGGIVTPEMFGRIDLSKFQTGLADCLNFITLPHGPAARRPGTRFVQQARDRSAAGEKKKVKLVPFVFGAGQAYVVEMGTSYARFHNGSGTELAVNQAVAAVTQANPAVFDVPAHGWSAGTWVYVHSMPGMESLVGAFYIVDTVIDASHVTLRRPPTTTATGALVDTSAIGPLTGAGLMAKVYEVASPYTAADNLRWAQNNDVLTFTATLRQMRELRRLGAANWTFTAVVFTPTLTGPAGVTATATIPTATNPTVQTYMVTALAADGVTESVANNTATATNNLAIAGNFNTITWTDNGAARYYVYKLKGGVFGYIGQATTGATGIVDDNITPDTLTSPPTDSIVLNTVAEDSPQAVTYYERRRWFAGTPTKPQNLWATRSGTEANLTSSLPARDDDGIEARLAAQQAQEIRHLVALQDVVALTASSHWRIFSDSGGGISLPTMNLKPQGAVGASYVQPVLSEETALYVQAKGAYIRELIFNGEGVGRFSSENVSIMAPHLFDGFEIVDIAYSLSPTPVLWAVRSDGALLGLTHMPKQQVYGWHRHEIGGGGLVESVAVIPEGSEDVLYMAVRRYYEDGSSVVTIERMTTRVFGAQDDAFFVDCGLTYSGPAVSTISGLWQHEGREVQVLADGAVGTPRTVVNGAIALDAPAATVHVGLGYTSDLETLPQAYEGAPASGQGAMKNVRKVFLRVKDSSLVKAGPRFDKLRAYPARDVSDDYGTPPALRTGELAITIDPSWNTDGRICVRQDEPLPLTVCAITHDTAVGGG